MRPRNWLALGAAALGAFGAGLAVKSFLPQHLLAADESATVERGEPFAASALPDIDVTFLRCGSRTVPLALAARGSLSPISCTIAHSAVLIRHPRATFLYDSGLCLDIYAYLADQPWLFRRTLANFVLEEALGSHLRRLGLRPSDLDFALISHLHWDHVSGVPDLPGVPLRLNRVEHDALRLGLVPESRRQLLYSLLGANPIELFDCDGPPYEGFRASHDLLGDGSLVLVPLPGHTPGQVGLFINRANGPRLLLLGDAAWIAANYRIPATMHPLLWSAVTQDDATARQTLIELHRFARRRPEVIMVPMHDAATQEACMAAEGPTRLRASL